MITISVKNLAEAVREADAFSLPEINDGVSYLYNYVYRRISAGYDVKLSELDFDAFDADDVDSLSDLYSDVFEHNHYRANGIASALRSINPESKAVAYV